MVDLKELWIGDELVINSSGRVGRFAGINQEGKARIDVNGKIFLAPAHNLRPYNKQVDPFRQIDEMLGIGINKKIPAKIEAAKKEIDLHINILAPHLANELPAMILSYQLSRCKFFIEDTISIKQSRILIIHGKGEGVLKSEVLHLAKQYKEISFTLEGNDRGALEVWLQY